MRERPVLKIGEFARVGQVSIATLRHYEKSGLLKQACRAVSGREVKTAELQLLMDH